MADSPQAQLRSFQSVAGAMKIHAEASLGQDGMTIITGTDDVIAPNGKHWKILMFITAGEIDEMDIANTIEGSYAGVTFPAGFPLYGKFRSVKLASGSLVAYY